MKMKIQVYTSNLFYFLVLILIPVVATAQDFTRSYTVDELIQQSLLNHDLLTARKEKFLESGYARKQSREWQNPTTGGDISKKTIENKSGLSYGFSLNQEFSFPGKRALREEIAKYEENLALLEFDEMKHFIRYEVFRLSYDYSIILFKVKHIHDRLARFNLINNYMRGHLQLAPQRVIESYLVKEKLLILERDVLRLSTEQRISYELLNIYTRMKETTMPFIQTDWFTSAPRFELESLLAKADENCFVVNKQKEFLKKAAKEVDLATREPYPDINISVFYREQSVIDTEREIGAGITFPIPILTRNKNSIEKFRAKTRSESALLNFARETVAGEIKRLHSEYIFYASMLDRFPVSRMEELERRMRYADSEFRKGRVDFQTYLEMESQTHESIETILGTQMNIVRLYSSIMFLTSRNK